MTFRFIVIEQFRESIRVARTITLVDRQTEKREREREGERERERDEIASSRDFIPLVALITYSIGRYGIYLHYKLVYGIISIGWINRYLNRFILFRSILLSFGRSYCAVYI